MNPAALDVWVIYAHPSDYPDKFVVRLQMALPGGGIAIAPTPTAVTDTLEAARAAIPSGLYRLDRRLEDDAVIVETWI